jgi:hypothetical protein
MDVEEDEDQHDVPISPGEADRLLEKEEGEVDDDEDPSGADAAEEISSAWVDLVDMEKAVNEIEQNQEAPMEHADDDGGAGSSQDPSSTQDK